jgi:hypothetical protein
MKKYLGWYLTKLLVVSWQCILLLGVLFLPGCWYIEFSEQEFLSIPNLFFDIFEVSFKFYRSFLFIEDVLLENGSRFPFPPAVWALAMACLSLVAWNKKPGRHTMLSTIIGVWGLCGVPYPITLFVLVVVFASMDRAVWVVYFPLSIAFMLCFLAPSLYILYHFRASFQKRRELPKSIEPAYRRSLLWNDEATGDKTGKEADRDVLVDNKDIV